MVNKDPLTSKRAATARSRYDRDANGFGTWEFRRVADLGHETNAVPGRCEQFRCAAAEGTRRVDALNQGVHAA